MGKRERHRRKARPRLVLGDPADPEGLGFLMRELIQWMAVTGRTPASMKLCEENLDFFLHWCDERSLNKAREITKPMLERFQRWLYQYRKADGQPISFRSQYRFLASVRMFFKWLTRKNYLLSNPASELELPRLYKRLPKAVLTAAEAEQVISQADAREPLGIRDRALLETLYSTGIRRMEVVNLKIHDLDRDRGTIMIRQGKGKKDRLIPIGERALKWMVKYVDDIRPELTRGLDEGALFLTALGEPFSLGGLSQIVSDYVKRANLKKSGSCHLFRHTMATLMLENGADTRFIQAMLGHADLSTTEIYTHVTIKKLKEVHTATHPAKMKKTPECPPSE